MNVSIVKLASVLFSLALVVATCPYAPAVARAETDGPKTPASTQAALCADIPSDETSYVPDELIVTYDADAVSNAQGSEAAAADLEARVDRVEQAEVVAGPKESQGATVKVELESGCDLQNVQQELAQQEGVASVQPNYRYRTQGTVTVNDPYVSRQYYLGGASKHGANLAEAWSYAKCNHAVTVAVLDTGFDLKHEDLKANMLASLAWDAENEEKLVDGDVSHGTMVAGVIAAQASASSAKGIAGGSYNAYILPIKVFEDDGQYCSSSALAIAYEHIFDLIDAGKVKNLHVVNMSIGGYGGTDSVLNAAIDKARKYYDIVTVCAGGNGNYEDVLGSSEDLSSVRPRTDKCYPADYTNCVSVTSLDAKGANSVWSDYNSYKDISAPGESVYSTYSTNGSSKHNRYMYMSGTSAAAPVVSSAFALLWARVPGLTVSQAVSAITKTATPVTGNDHGAKTGSAGCVDAAAAVVKAAKLKPLAGASVKVSSATYTGKSLKPKVTVKLKGKKLVKGTDYLVVYRNNKRIGKGTAIVKGKGAYAGNIVKKFTIKVPAKVKKVKKSKGKKLKLTAKSGLWAKVSYGKVKYATGYQIAFKRSSAKKWKKAKLKARKAELVGLASGKTYKVKVRPYIKCCGKYYYGKWSTTKKVKARRW